MAVRHRKEIRDYLAAGLNSAITSAQRVDGYQRTDIGSDSPVVRVMSSGSDRPAIVTKGDRSKFRFLIQSWTLFTEVEGQWTEADAESAMDEIERQVATWISANQNIPDYWLSLTYDGFSSVTTAKEAGEVWLVETMPVIAEVYEP